MLKTALLLVFALVAVLAAANATTSKATHGPVPHPSCPAQCM